MAATALLRLGKLCGRSDYLAAAQRTLATFTDVMSRHPTAAGQLLIALDFQMGPTPELVLMAPPSDADPAAVLADLRRRYLPNKVVARRPGGTPSPRLDALFAGKPVPASGVPLSVCHGFPCQAPAILAALSRSCSTVESRSTRRQPTINDRSPRCAPLDFRK